MAAPIITPQAQGTGRTFPVPAPFLGLNTREAFNALRPDEARVLENWLPDIGSCRVRPGYTTSQTITGASTVPMLTLYKGATSQKLIAGANGELHDVTGTPSTLTAATYALNRWSTENFNGYLFGVNGTDTPWRYEGTTVAATGFTGPTLTTLQTITQVRNRLWVTQTNNADVRYGGIGAVTGALTTFQLSQVASGGKCMDVGSWSRDAGDGSDDLTVFVMSTGQVIVYQGDPATSFSLIGKYAAPAPVGVDCTIKIGGELVVMTVSGPIPVSAIIAGQAFDPEAMKYWGKIAPSWKKDYTLYGANAGWNAHFFDGIVYFNVQTGLVSTKQYVYNTRVPAWTIYTRLPALQFADYNGHLYFGSSTNGIVYRHATGSDASSQIIAVARSGFTYPSQGANNLLYTMIRAGLQGDGLAQGQFQVDTDFNEGEINSSLVDIVSSAAGASWGDDWGSVWGHNQTTRTVWRSCKGLGRAVAPVVRVRSTADNVVWYSCDIMAVPGGQI